MGVCDQLARDGGLRAAAGREAFKSETSPKYGARVYQIGTIGRGGGLRAAAGREASNQNKFSFWGSYLVSEM